MTGQLKSASEGRGSDPTSSVIELIKISVQTAAKRIRLKAGRLKNFSLDRYTFAKRKLMQYRIIIQRQVSRLFSGSSGIENDGASADPGGELQSLPRPAAVSA